MTRFRSSLVLIGSLLALSGCTSGPQPAPLVAPLQSASTGAKPPAALPAAQAAEACFAAAEELEKQGYDADAITQYENARQQNPRLPKVTHRLALLCDRQGNDDRALNEYHAALEAEPRNADLLNDFGCFFYERNDGKQAETWLRKALDVDSKHARAWTNLGKTLAQQARYQESYDAFAHVVRPAQAFSNVAVIQAKQGKLEEAKATLHHALELEPELKLTRAVLNVLEKTPATPSVDSEEDKGTVPIEPTPR